jgi:hypothetical protein
MEIRIWSGSGVEGFTSRTIFTTFVMVSESLIGHGCYLQVLPELGRESLFFIVPDCYSDNDTSDGLARFHVRMWTGTLFV